MTTEEIQDQQENPKTLGKPCEPCAYCGCPYPNDHAPDCPVLDCPALPLVINLQERVNGMVETLERHQKTFHALAQLLIQHGIT